MSPCCAHGEEVLVTVQDCAAITAYHPPPDVAYQAGVDVNGGKVAPADLPSLNGNDQPLVVNQDFTIDLNADLTRYGVSQRATHLYQPQANVGRLTVKPDGTILYNGKVLSTAEGRTLAAACAARH